jgi:hypothetical protein
MGGYLSFSNKSLGFQKYLLGINSKNETEWRIINIKVIQFMRAVKRPVLIKNLVHPSANN